MRHIVGVTETEGAQIEFYGPFLSRELAENFRDRILATGGVSDAWIRLLQTPFLPLMTRESFLATSGTKCPSCKSESLDYLATCQGNTYYEVTRECKNCGIKHNAIYKLDNFTVI
jgi:Zn ribbon nucleic-acid-binding protein